MNHDASRLGRALDDLADAAARSAQHGIVGSASVAPTLNRLVTRVRRRRAAKAVGSGALALAVVGLAAGAVQLGLPGQPVAPPAGGPTTGATASPSPVHDQGWAFPGVNCHQPESVLTDLEAETATPPIAAVGPLAIAADASDETPDFTVTVANIAAKTVDLESSAPRVVVVRESDHTVVGGGVFDTGTRGPAQAGESTDFAMTQPLWACSDGSAAESIVFTRSTGIALPPGEYELWVLVQVYSLATGDGSSAVGGPFPLTLTDPAATPPATADPVDALFPCGRAPTVTETGLPDVAGLMLAADIPDTGWSAATAPAWSAVLTGADTRVVSGSVAVELKVAFVGSDGLVAGLETSGDVGWTPFTVTSGTPATFPGGGLPTRCDGTTGLVTGDTDPAVPAGTYTAWPYARVTVESVTRPDGSADVPPAGTSVVVGTPHQVTFGG